MKILDLAGSHHEMGRQHAHQVHDLWPQIVKVLQQRLRNLEAQNVDLQPYILELTSAWEEIARPTLEMLRGMAEGLGLDWDPFFRYTVASHLEDRLRHLAYGEGCTVWAASGPITHQGLPILAKNRDYRPDHQDLQCLARAHPVRGHRYLYVTSAGSPAVFSSGLNEVGLAVADTHVAPCENGPGLARYSAMMEILEHHSHVSSALDYLRQAPHIGDGTLTLVDQTGDMAVFEAGHATHSTIRPEHGYVISTNHFRGTGLRECWIDSNPPELQGNSQNRFARVATALGTAGGQVDATWAQALMADHGGSSATVAQRKQHAICRHRDVDPQSTTVSSALFLPQKRTLLFANGQPCQAPFQIWPVI